MEFHQRDGLNAAQIPVSQNLILGFTGKVISVIRQRIVSCFNADGIWIQCQIELVDVVNVTQKTRKNNYLSCDNIFVTRNPWNKNLYRLYIHMCMYIISGIFFVFHHLDRFCDINLCSYFSLSKLIMMKSLDEEMVADCWYLCLIWW